MTDHSFRVLRPPTGKTLFVSSTGLSEHCQPDSVDRQTHQECVSYLVQYERPEAWVGMLRSSLFVDGLLVVSMKMNFPVYFSLYGKKREFKKCPTAGVFSQLRSPLSDAAGSNGLKPRDVPLR